MSVMAPVGALPHAGAAEPAFLGKEDDGLKTRIGIRYHNIQRAGVHAEVAADALVGVKLQNGGRDPKSWVLKILTF